ncbi:uncharacterized protein LOC125787864 [Astyanax mexicanus]|uniref:uncharacterized protein LOC125787864 n=1 Tax=Astyanax mexicanus TaxID=7994 RepID=UPI0020CB3B99|nr:uncharacterized protein LOC125787864 [Astyanax mexicanus]
MKTGALLCCFTLCLVLSSVTSINNLTKIQDLQNTQFGRQYPRHGLLLLHWFANNIEIDNNNVNLLHQNPNRGDFGFHRYRNYEIDQNSGRSTFPQCPSLSTYYSVGNINNVEVRSMFPSYVTRDYHTSPNNPLRNIDRLVIRVQNNNPRRVEEVYITQHYRDRNRGSGYDPENTYRVSTSLLQQIQNLANQDNNAQQLNNLYRSESGLSPFLTETGYDRNYRILQFSLSQFCSNSKSKTYRFPRSVDPNLQCETPRDIKLEVKSTSKGYARISWSEIPESLVEDNKIGLYKDDRLLTDYSLNGKTFGTEDTSTYLNSGLQVKLLTSDKNEVIWTGPKFNDANGVLPTDLIGNDASLQLYTIDGYACARLFIKKSFTDWENVFYNSWVGFYSSAKDANKQYGEYQYVVKFKKITNQDLSEKYDIREYKSGVAIGPGVQARFLLDKGYTNVAARTKAWDGVISPVWTNDELRK